MRSGRPQIYAALGSVLVLLACSRRVYRADDRVGDSPDGSGANDAGLPLPADARPEFGCDAAVEELCVGHEVFVSPSGRPSASGSAEDPLDSLAAAIGTCEGACVVNLAEGEYIVQNGGDNIALRPAACLTISGGWRVLEDGSWTHDGERSSIRVAAASHLHQPVTAISSRVGVFLDRVAVSGHCSAAIAAPMGTVLVRDSQLSCVSAGVRASGATSVVLCGSEVTSSDGPALSIAGGEDIAIVGSRLRGIRGVDYGRDAARLTLEEVHIESVREGILVSGEASDLVVRDSIVSSGSAAVSEMGGSGAGLLERTVLRTCADRAIETTNDPAWSHMRFLLVDVSVQCDSP